MFFKKKLTNFKIIERKDKNDQDYFIIFDNDQFGGNNAYFCWDGSVKTGWNDLLEKRSDWKEIEIEFEEKEKGNKVVNIWSELDGFEILV